MLTAARKRTSILMEEHRNAWSRIGSILYVSWPLSDQHHLTPSSEPLITLLASFGHISRIHRKAFLRGATPSIQPPSQKPCLSMSPFCHKMAFLSQENPTDHWNSFVCMWGWPAPAPLQHEHQGFPLVTGLLPPPQKGDSNVVDPPPPPPLLTPTFSSFFPPAPPGTQQPGRAGLGAGG